MTSPGTARNNVNGGSRGTKTRICHWMTNNSRILQRGRFKKEDARIHAHDEWDSKSRARMVPSSEILYTY
jgi:hypothetical protein